MKNLTDEIKLTIEMMQGDIDDGAHGELQSHLYSLLEMKRNEIQQRLVERSWSEPVSGTVETVTLGLSFDSGLIREAKPLTAEELKAGGWWCGDVSKDCANAFESKGLRVINSFDWGSGADLIGCGLDDSGGVTRCIFEFIDEKQIHRIGNEFYWGDA